MTSAYTLQLLHTSDQEAGIPALQDAIGLSAVMNALEDDYDNTLKLSSGDLFIAGPFFDASRSIYDSASEGEPIGEPGYADILIQNELGWDVASVGNHEFDAGDTTFFNLLAPDADIVNGAAGGQGIGEGGYAGAAFPYIANNLSYENASLPEGLNVVENGGEPQPNSLTGSVIVDVNGENIGVLGAVTPYLPAIANIGDVEMLTGDDITASTPIDIQVDALIDNLQPEVQNLTDAGVNKIVLMTHLQEAEIEQALAQELADLNIPVDILIGGGSHRVMANGTDIPPLREDETQQNNGQLLQPYPQEFTAGENTVYYINTGANYRYLSQLVADFDETGVITNIGNDSGTFATDIAGVDRLYDEDIADIEDVKAVADPDVVAIVDGVGNYVNELDGNIFGQTEVFLNGIRGDVRTQETNLGNIAADAQDYYAEQYLKTYGDDLLAQFENIDISFKNGGGIRDAIGVSFVPGGGGDLVQLPPQANPNVGKEEGDISQLDISNSLRFDNKLTVGKVTAMGLYEIAEHMVSGVETVSGRFGQIGGFKFSFDPEGQPRTTEQEGDRIQNLVLTDDMGNLEEIIIQDGELLGDPNREFSVVTLEFLAGGGDSYPDVIYDQVNLTEFAEPETLGRADLVSGGEQDALAEYLAVFFNKENEQAPFTQADTSQEEDERIQNLEFRDDTILEDTEETGLQTLRVATFNASLNRSEAGELIDDLSTPDDAQVQAVAEIIQRANPDILLVNEFDFDEEGEAAELFQDNYLSVSQNGVYPVEYPYVYVAPSNTGIASGFDLDNNGEIVTNPGEPGYGGDAFGFGDFPGQYGMVVYSKYAIAEDQVRTFQNFLWKDMPGALLPVDPETEAPWYSEEELEVFRLSSKSHWDIPIEVNGETIHVLASHPTPPVFDGPEDRNGTRNHDEIRFWADYITPGEGDYIYDDAGNMGGLSEGSQFVMMGDQNADPYDGDSVDGAIWQMLENPWVNPSFTPASEGGVEATERQGGANLNHIGNPAFDTGDFNPNGSGNLRVDYVLPSQNTPIFDGAVVWPTSDDPLFDLVGPGFPAVSSDHRMVWKDIALSPNVSGTGEDETLEGTPEDDFIVASSGDDGVAGDLGDDQIYGNEGNDVLRGDLNDRTPQIGVGGDDVIFGGEGSDRIGGKGGNDKLFGDRGNDRIWGDDGDDLIRGGLGNDVLVGDDFSGGSGSDTFILAVGEGTDTILDFEVGVDFIGLVGGFTFGDLDISRQGGNTLIELNGETLAILRGVTETLTEAEVTLVQ